MKKLAFLILAMLTSLSAFAHSVTFYNSANYTVDVYVWFPTGQPKYVSVAPHKAGTIELDEAINGKGTFKPDSKVTVKYDMAKLSKCFPDGNVIFFNGSSALSHWITTSCKQ
jgi:hypothetical protein